MSAPSSEISIKRNLRKLLLPVSIGIGVSLYLIITNFNPAALRAVHVNQKLIVGLLLALFTVLVRDFAFMYKVRLSTGNKMTWLKTFQTICMWEFGACITPKLSEAAFTIFVLKKSGLTYGKSTAVLMLNAFLDNVAFVVVFSVLYFTLGGHILFISGDCPDLHGHKIMQGIRGLANKAWIGFALILAFCIFLWVALFIFPQTTKRFFHRIGRLRFLSRFKDSITNLGDEIEITAQEFKNQPFGFWFKMTIATFINWISRYLLINALLFAFSVTDLNMAEVFARQYVLWIFISIPSTPGASGVAELSFIAMNCEFMSVGLSAAIALLWRFFSYYLYLILGIIVLPKWVAQIAATKLPNHS